MVVSPRIASEANSLWILPLKCKSEQIKFSLMKDSPQLYGMDYREIAKNKLTNITYAMISTQIWTIPICYYNHESLDYPQSSDLRQAGDTNGVHIELLNVDSVPALMQQLEKYKKSISETQLANYAKYLNQEYSLLTVWKEGNEPNTAQVGYGYRHRPAIYVEFPSEKPSYPLLNMNGRFGRLTLTLIGFWQIEEQDQSEAFICDQRISQGANLPDSMLLSQEKNVDLTIFSRSRNSVPVQGELTFVPGKLKQLKNVDTIAKLPYQAFILPGLIAFAFISYLSAGISGVLTFRKWRGYAEFGLWNLLSIVAMGIVISYKKGGINEILKQNKWRTRLYLIFFSILFTAMSFGLLELLKILLNLR
jgi:hypothetical protein